MLLQQHSVEARTECRTQTLVRRKALLATGTLLASQEGIHLEILDEILLAELCDDMGLTKRNCAMTWD
jgi:hypothetical protein